MHFKKTDIRLLQKFAKSTGSYRLPVDSRDDEKNRLFSNLNSLAEKVVDVEQSRRDAIANVSHELRTPITALRAMAENLVDGVIAPQPTVFKLLLAQSEKLSELVNFMLDISRIESGVSDLEISRFSVARFLAESVEALVLLEPEKKLTFTINVHPDSLQLMADRLRMSQMMDNLILNSIKFAPPKSEVLISAVEEQNEIVFTVGNCGPGIPESERERIFQRFNTSSTDQEGGTGIGLTIVDWIVRLHGGSVRVLDTEIGAVFEVRIPA
jgi:signal transduction histidine kinase